MHGFLAKLLGSLAILALVACQPSQTGGPSVATGSAPAMPAGSYMETIQKRGMLKAGLRQDVLLYGFLDPVTNKWDGFDVAMAREIARAIFGDPNKIEMIRITSAQRIPFLQEDQVDLVVATMTINKDRLNQIDFSDIYYMAGQQVLVKGNSTITSIQDTNGKKVCATKGSTSEQNIVKFAPRAEPVLLDSYTECLTALQQGRADAVSTDDVILKGLQKQDPSTKIVGPLFTDEPYGIGMKKGRPEFVKFVNDLIGQMKKDGRWAAIYKQYLGEPVPQPPPATIEYK
ncbi:MAG: glutamate ABC transporter substrate-binding protein [Dehalococcoidia bacterium]